MKKKFGPISQSLLLMSLCFQAKAQGVMPVPSDFGLMASSCQPTQQFRVLTDPVEKAINVNLSSLVCDPESLFGTPFQYGTNLNHDRNRCSEIAYCSSHLKEQDLKDAEKIIAQNISTAVFITILSKAIEEHKDFNINLRKLEQKNKTKICPEDKLEFDCDTKIRRLLNLVGNSLIDYPEFDSSPASSSDLNDFVAGKFFSKDTVMVKTEDELKKDCSKKLSLQKVCQQTRERIKIVKECDRGMGGKNCFAEEQKAWANLTNGFKDGDKDFYLAIEKRLCLPQRVSNSSSPSTIGDRNLLIGGGVGNSTSSVLGIGLSKPRPQNLNFNLPSRLLSDALNSGSERVEGGASNSPAKEDVKPQDRFNFGGGVQSTAVQLPSVLRTDIVGPGTSLSAVRENSDDIVQGLDKKDSLSDSFRENFRKVGETIKTENAPINPNMGWDVIGRARELAEEQKIPAEESNKIQVAAEKMAQNESENKNESINSLMAQMSGLQGKLDAMNTKIQDLQEKKEAAQDKEEASASDDEILSLKKQIEELQKDKIRKEAEAKILKETDLKALKAFQIVREQREQEERDRHSPATSLTSNSRFAQSTQAGYADKEAGMSESGKAGKSASSFAAASEASRGPASVVGAQSGGQQQPGQLVLKNSGGQASAESSVVYMTANELQHYPYHLGEQATLVDIEKMLEGNRGSSIIIGNSEKIVPMMENGQVALDENGKIKFKRVKIALVKNDKEKKIQIDREISSVADLKREEQKKRDLIRYQEMKKALMVK